MTVTAAPPPPPAGSEFGGAGVDHIFNGGNGGLKDLGVVVHVANDLGAAVVDVTLNNTTSGATWIGSAATLADGSVSFRLRDASAGYYSTDVEGIAAAGHDLGWLHWLVPWNHR